MPQCTAMSKRSRQQCRRHAVTGYNVCQMHGAGSPKQGRPGGRPPKDPLGGRYARLLPERMLTRYQQAIADPAKLELMQEIALVDTRIADVLSRIDTGEAGKNWFAAQDHFDNLKVGIQTGNEAKQKLAFVNLERCIAKGVSDYAAWGEIGSLIDQRLKLTESERKRLVQEKQLVEVEEAVNYIRAFLDILKAHVDITTLEAVKAEFMRLAKKTGDDVL
jgi:hypothetical protein